MPDRDHRITTAFIKAVLTLDKMKQIFEIPCESTKNRFKNKSKKVLRTEIAEMISTKENKLSKNDLISLWQILNGLPCYKT